VGLALSTNPTLCVPTIFNETVVDYFLSGSLRLSSTVIIGLG